MKRRDFTKSMAGAMLGLMVPVRRAAAVPAAPGLSDPALQPKFMNLVPDALAPGFKFDLRFNRGRAANVKVALGPAVQQTGLLGPGGLPVGTPLFGYGDPAGGFTWPGRTFEVMSGQPVTVRWENKLVDPLTGFPLNHLLPVDTSLHWAYSLMGYESFSIPVDGVPVVAHLHGGHSAPNFDGNPEYFFSPGWGVRGPRWVVKDYVYDNDQPAGNLWYHDHALGITRLNVYAGMAGFYFIRDEDDTGLPDNPLGLPAWPYEKAYAIQDRMFRETGELFYPAFPGDPFYDDFITSPLGPPLFPGGGPTALAEFFGDHMVVNGLIWPKENVEPRNYRLHLLNGTDSRFLVVRFRVTNVGATDLLGASDPIPFYVVGSDQGLAGGATMVDTLVVEPGGRYDIVFDFSQLGGYRVIMENIGGDAPFGGDFGDALGEDDVFPGRQTDRIMAFDVVLPMDMAVPDAFDPTVISHFGGNPHTVDRTRKVALFEGTDEYGRLQPLLGTAEPATDYAGNPINWPATPEYSSAGLVGQMEGAVAWHDPTTENPALGTTEIWEIYNATMDAHPIHLHLVHFEVLDRQEFTADLVEQPVVQHNGALGSGFRLENIVLGVVVDPGPEYVENAPKDMVTALPGQVTRIKATFDRPGRYVWHCHILSHEDHEMMRVFHVGPGA
jgi:spore coat protein A, manganese oxidase